MTGNAALIVDDVTALAERGRLEEDAERRGRDSGRLKYTLGFDGLQLLVFHRLTGFAGT